MTLSNKYFEARGVTKTYEDVPVIENISLSLNKGQRAALLGLSGIGKTTLFNVLSGITHPDEGRIYLDGQEITNKSGMVGYMQQKDLLLPFKRVIDNICIPLKLKGVPKAQARKQAFEYTQKFGLKGYEDKYPSQLSGGMRQRAALLRTYLFKNEIMLLDEPFSALDAFTKREMHNWFLESLDGVTTLFITHDIDEAILFADKIYIMSGVPGKITHKLNCAAHQTRNLEYTMTNEFLEHKHEILKLIHNS